MDNPYSDIHWPVNCSWAHTHTFGGENIHIKDLYGELIELLQATSMHEAWGELQQVWLYSLILLYQCTGLNLPLYGVRASLEEDIHRYSKWVQILDIYGLELDIKDFSRRMSASAIGNNYRRPHKVQWVLAHRGIHISLDEAASIISSIG